LFREWKTPIFVEVSDFGEEGRAGPAATVEAE